MHLSRIQLLWVFIACVILLRLITLAFYPLMDTTEARYGEIARIMAETGNWITPQIDYDRPFWGKPPLYAWVSAISMLVLGNSEFSLRLPHLLTAVLILVLLWQFALHLKYSVLKATTIVAVVATTTGFLISSGVIMTDMLLTLSMTMVMIGFWRGWHGERRYNYLMYVGLAIGLLSKGPLIIVLAGLAIFPWLVIHAGFTKLWKQLWQRSNLLSGLALTLLISVPWYLLAESATPGFLDYFIVGEHFQRFVVSGWQGDLYGSGHPRTKGTIWVYWFTVCLPWSPILIWVAVRKFLDRKNTEKPGDAGLTSLLFLWMLSPLILFTLAANILPAYVLPGMPAIGLLIAANFNFKQHKRNDLLFLFGPVVLIIIATILIFRADENGYKLSDKTLLSGIDSSIPLYYYKRRPYSAQYYSNGKAKKIDTTQPGDEQFYLVVGKSRVNDADSNRCIEKASNKKRILFLCQNKN